MKLRRRSDDKHRCLTRIISSCFIAPPPQAKLRLHSPKRRRTSPPPAQFDIAFSPAFDVIWSSFRYHSLSFDVHRMTFSRTCAHSRHDSLSFAQAFDSRVL